MPSNPNNPSGRVVLIAKLYRSIEWMNSEDDPLIWCHYIVMIGISILVPHQQLGHKVLPAPPLSNHQPASAPLDTPRDGHNVRITMNPLEEIKYIILAGEINEIAPQDTRPATTRTVVEDYRLEKDAQDENNNVIDLPNPIALDEMEKFYEVGV